MKVFEQFGSITIEKGYTELEPHSTVRGTSWYRWRERALACFSQYAIPAFWLISFATTAIVAFVVGRETTPDWWCTKQLYPWSPALDAASKYHKETFLGNFTEPSVYRGEPSKELDEAWRGLSLDGMSNLEISPQDLWRVNKTADGVVFNNDGRVPIILEVFHQLHCLDSIRKATWGPEHYPEIFEGKSARKHIEHCVEVLRQYLMCTADVSVITSIQVPFKDLPDPDFSTMHVCRDFNGIFEWTRDNNVVL